MPIKPDGKTYLDTGGGNWEALYRHFDKTNLNFFSEYLEEFRDGGVHHSDKISFFSSQWLHTINGSYWTKSKPKEDLIEDILRRHEKSNAFSDFPNN